MVCTPGTSRVDSWLRNRLELLLLILAVLVPQYLAAQGASIHGWVLGKAAEPPHEAKVILTNKTNRKDKIPIFAKPTGEYGRHQIPPGIYELTACDSNAYLPAAPVVSELKDGETKNINFWLEDPPGHGTYKGTMRKSGGAVLPSALLVVKAKPSGCELTRASTNNEGEFSLAALPAPATYELYLESDGFEPVVTDISVGVNQEVAAELIMKHSSVGDTVEVATGHEIKEVTAEAPQLLTRNYFQLLLFSPGAIGETESNLGVDLETANLKGTPLTARNVSPFGSDIPAVPTNVATRAGDHARNAFHGLVRYSFDSDAIDAKNYFTLPGFSTYRNHMGTVEVGGPIFKEPFFFFVAYDLSRGAKAPTFSPVTLPLLPTLNGRLLELGLQSEDLRQALTTWATDQPIIRFDYDIATKHMLTVRYNFGRDALPHLLGDDIGGTSELPSSARELTGQDHLLRVHYNYGGTVSRINSETIYSYSYDFLSSIPVSPEETSLFLPGVGVVGRATNLSYGDSYSRRTQFLSESAKARFSRHGLSAAVQLARETSLLDYSAFQSGRAIFPSLSSFTAPVPIPDLFEIGQGRSRVTWDSSLLRLSFTDNFEITPKFVLDFGVGYKAELLPAFQRDEHAFEPRLALKWNIAPDASVRVGYALLRGQLPQLPVGLEVLMGGGFRADLPPPMRRVSSFVGASSASNAMQQFFAFGTVPPGPELAVTYNRNSHSPITQTLTLSLTKKIDQKLTLDLGYLYAHSTQLLTVGNVNLPPPVVINGRQDFGNRVILPQFAQVYQFQTNGSSIYHGASISARGIPLNKLLLQAKYSFSKTIDEPLSEGSFETASQNPLNPRADRAVSSADGGHAFSVSGRWDLPAIVRGKGPRYLYFLNHFYTVNVFNYQSGRHYNVLAGFDANHDGNPLTDRPLNVGRNTFLGQRFARLDLRFGSHFQIQEKFAFDISANFVNLFNRTNFAAFDTVLGKSDLRGLDPRIVFGRSLLPEYRFRQALTPNGFGLGTSAFAPRRTQLELAIGF